MAFCGNCGTKFEDSAKFCPSCGAVTTGQAAAAAASTAQQPVATAAPPAAGDKDIADNKMMAVLSYFGLLVLIPIFAAKESPYARFHANQGLVLCIASVAYGILYAILSTILYAISFTLGMVVGGILGLASWAFLVFAILGIINASQGKMKPLPLIGGITILK